uniref:Methyltransferase ubiE/COQ5 family protein n=1 Tax=Sorangium cellulosum TaxID=56 RepID=A0A3S7UVU7_SORCE|nr:methyltransferase ubiE/COQ5 family protein [Sorangium cellulosum]
MNDQIRLYLMHQLALSLHWWNAAVFQPAIYRKKLGLYVPATLGAPPSPGVPTGGGQRLTLDHAEPELLPAEPDDYEGVREFDAHSADYDALVRPFSDPIVAEVIELLRPHLARNARILDPSAGPGSAAIQLSRLVPEGEVIAADLSRGMVETAHRNARAAGCRNMAFFQADVARPPTAFEGYFDAIFCCLSFHHYPDGAAAARAFRTVLAPHGKAFIADPGPAWFIELARTISVLADPGFVQHRTGEEFQRMFTEAGFSSVYWVEALPGIGVTIASV